MKNQSKCIYDSAYYLISFIAGKVQDKVQGKAGKASRGRPWYFIAAAAAGLVLCVLILVAWITVLEEDVLQQKRGLRKTLLLTIRPLSRKMPNTLTLTWTHKSEFKELFHSSTIANGQSILIEQQQGSHGCPLASDLAELLYLMSARATYAPFLFYSFKK